ncbi:MAG: hypothetical protein OXI96_06420 [Acidimicrobiaceae bacterium]|nr:hypothetical protein [Acidimicrobiaceae bacterium]
MTPDNNAPGAVDAPPIEPAHEEPAVGVDSAQPDRSDGLTSGHSASGNKCKNAHCYAPKTPCHLGDLKLTECENWQTNGAESSGLYTEGDRPPWSGLALGSVDLNAIAGTGRPRVVALIGAPNAGKTSALAAYFIRLRRDYESNGLSFAGSYTILGWDQIAHYAEFPPNGSRGFPPHTTSGRSPALLHVRLASNLRNLYNVFFTDVPGEWFEEWAIEADAAPGAQWIADRADLFVLLSDSDALSGPDQGRARSSYQNLAMRVSSVANGREVYPVRAKADLPVPDTIDKALEHTDTELFGMAATPLSVIRRSPIPDPIFPLDEAIRKATAPRRLEHDDPRQLDPFLGFRERLRPT